MSGRSRAGRTGDAVGPRQVAAIPGSTGMAPKTSVAMRSARGRDHQTPDMSLHESGRARRRRRPHPAADPGREQIGVQPSRPGRSRVDPVTGGAGRCTDLRMNAREPVEQPAHLGAKVVRRRFARRATTRRLGSCQRWQGMQHRQDGCGADRRRDQQQENRAITSLRMKVPRGAAVSIGRADSAASVPGRCPPPAARACRPDPVVRAPGRRAGQRIAPGSVDGAVPTGIGGRRTGRQRGGSGWPSTTRVGASGPIHSPARSPTTRQRPEARARRPAGRRRRR